MVLTRNWALWLALTPVVGVLLLLQGACDAAHGAINPTYTGDHDDC